MQTVEENKMQFTKKEIEAAENTRKLYHIIRRPGYKVFYDILKKRLIHNCSISSQDAKNAYRIYGPDGGALMGKCTRKTPNKVDTSKLYQVSKDFVQKYQHLTLAIDILYFERMSFILTVSRNIHFYTVEKLPNRDNKTLLQCLKKVVSMYNSRGFYVQYILADGEFRHMSGDIMSELKCHLNLATPGEHVPEAE